MEIATKANSATDPTYDASRILKIRGKNREF
jgi:hypothetical protein